MKLLKGYSESYNCAHNKNRHGEAGAIGGRLLVLVPPEARVAFVSGDAPKWNQVKILGAHQDKIQSRSSSSFSTFLTMAATTPSYTLPPLRPFINGVRDRSVRIPETGEIVLMRLPCDMPGPVSIISSSALSGSDDRNYHPCIVVGSFVGMHSWEVKIYVCRAYSTSPDSASYVSSLPPAMRNQLLPMPYHPRPSTPMGFGASLSFRNFLSDKPSWLIINSIIVDMGGNSPVSYFSCQVDVSA